ncbi:MAG: DNA methylase, partial [bacterium]
MAKSPSHKWGQIIGDFLEEVFSEQLAKFARKHKLYLDTQGERPARKGKKVSWVDSFENTHDLDFVLERNGTKNRIGEPVAFIESAWRRYTKHSRNKAQEIQGAILPLVATHKNFAPFIGVMLAGEFTGGALNQLKSLGFNVLYFPYDLILQSFKKYGIDASTEEDTSEKDFLNKIHKWESFNQKKDLARYLLKLNKNEIDNFFGNLEKAVSRFINSVSVLPLHGTFSTLTTIEEAIDFIENYRNINESLPVLKYEIIVRYNNNDKIEGIFNTKESAVEFLESYATPKPKAK